jgi:hypothetical protein
MRVHVPVPQANAGGAPVVHTARGPIRRIGVVDDNLDPPFMDALVAELERCNPGAEVRLWVKELGTAPATDDIFDAVRAWAEVAVSGVGM